jgi:hypothetical protein
MNRYKVSHPTDAILLGRNLHVAVWWHLILSGNLSWVSVFPILIQHHFVCMLITFRPHPHPQIQACHPHLPQTPSMCTTSARRHNPHPSTISTLLGRHSSVIDWQWLNIPTSTSCRKMNSDLGRMGELVTPVMNTMGWTNGLGGDFY